MAEIQGFLLQYKDDPRAAASNATHWLKRQPHADSPASTEVVIDENALRGQDASTQIIKVGSGSASPGISTIKANTLVGRMALNVTTRLLLRI